eukprot:scaffold119396_cov72-Phaeocystis_antarctica.AAC.3
MSGCVSSILAATMAFSPWRSMRTCSVRSPRARRKDSSGARGAPMSFCTFATSWVSSRCLTVTAPARMSEWPPMYLRGKGVWRGKAGCRILGSRVYRDVDARDLERALMERCGEGRVAHDPRLLVARALRPLRHQGTDRSEVGEAARGVGGRLGVHHL